MKGVTGLPPSASPKKGLRQWLKSFQVDTLGWPEH
jgi:hypothetical protein